MMRTWQLKVQSRREKMFCLKYHIKFERHKLFTSYAYILQRDLIPLDIFYLSSPLK
jgi:hypothetical protein